MATILSAQCTDERVNMVTPAVFAAYPGPADLAGADPADLEELIRPTGFFRSKAKSLIGMARALVERFGGRVPEDLDDLVTLPGVGRKTGNVVRSVAFGLPGLPVDTHVGRLSPAAGPHDRGRPGAGGARPERAGPGGRARGLQPPAHPPRPGRLHGPVAPLRGVPAGRRLPVGPQCPCGRSRSPLRVQICCKQVLGATLELGNNF